MLRGCRSFRSGLVSSIRLKSLQYHPHYLNHHHHHHHYYSFNHYPLSINRRKIVPGIRSKTSIDTGDFNEIDVSTEKDPKREEPKALLDRMLASHSETHFSVSNHSPLMTSLPHSNTARNHEMNEKDKIRVFCDTDIRKAMMITSELKADSYSSTPIEPGPLNTWVATAHVLTAETTTSTAFTRSSGSQKLISGIVDQELSAGEQMRHTWPSLGVRSSETFANNELVLDLASGSAFGCRRRRLPISCSGSAENDLGEPDPFSPSHLLISILYFNIIS
ncbi:unnamed protein product [Protopolystoma xenopodis]|uniref:Uncharacterized protein n=1 Tax=Protopolystoma xenopodis TaxID=117903 RepID=A0A448X7A4_9PLAT|nr:unnamed protein product [Protopolystoma xenopodis]